MQVAKAYQIIEEIKPQIFPNRKYSMETVENALIAADDSVESYMFKGKFKDPKTARILELILGIWGVGLFYAGHMIRGGIRLLLIILPSLVSIMLSAVGIKWDFTKFYVPYVLFFIVTMVIDIIQVPNICRRMNCKKVLDFARSHPALSYGNSSTEQPSTNMSAEDLLDAIQLESETPPSLAEIAPESNVQKKEYHVTREQLSEVFNIPENKE